MSETDAIFGKGNPFPFSPVVQLGGFADAVRVGEHRPKRYPTIVTDALTRLRRQVSDYLERPEPGGDLGRAIALVGEFGVGKSHMAREVTSAIRADHSIPLWVINQPSLDLSAVYRNRMLGLKDDQEASAAFERVVSTYYANIVVELLNSSDADELHIGPQQHQVVAGLREGTFDPRKVIQAFGIDRELMHRHLREHLRVAVDHRRFAVGLSLLLEGPFKQDVWDWLAAKEPSAALKERGITSAIDTTEDVFDALCVLSFLYGRVGQRYVLVIDALESVLGWRRRDYSQFMNGFEKLVNTFVNQDGLLVLCIQPEPWSRMPQGLHERVLQIWPTGLTGPETARLVSGYLRVGAARAGTPAGPGAAAGADPVEERPDTPGRPADYDTVVPPTDDETGAIELGPFEPDAVDEIAELSNGIPREILRICRRSWKRVKKEATAARRRTALEPALAEAPATPVIDVPRVHTAVRRMYEQRSHSDVLLAVERALAAGQWRREAPPPELGDPPEPATRDIAYWVRVGAGGALGVLPFTSVLEHAEIERIGRITRAAHRAFPRGECEILVVVNGYVSRRMRDRIAEVTRTSPVVVTDPDFTERLDRSLELLAARLEAAQRESTLDQVRARLTRVTEHQSGVLERIERLDTRLDRLAHTQTLQPPTRAESPRLPLTVARLFAEASGTLERLLDRPADLREALGVDSSGMAEPGGRPRRVTFSAPQFEAIGLATLLGMLLDTFHDSVGDWIATVTADRDGGLTEDQRNSLFVMCRSFEITLEVLPELRPDALPGAPGKGAGTREVRRAQVTETLSTLAERVQQTVIQLTDGGNGGVGSAAGAR
ncbi:hypothetical protein ACIQXD_17280 [Streptomyces uncialis]|uniref:hypothetical protein n=1 Tax=Streptomyces uncialis TaxID=1048205 RepID=UPI00382A8249